MSPLRKSGMISRSPLIRTRLAKKGPRAQEWQVFRAAEFEKDKDEEGLIRCQDIQIGLSHCGVASINMDLHHIEGRDGKLFLDKTKMVWLTRDCHGKAHDTKNRNTGRPSEAQRA